MRVLLVCLFVVNHVVVQNAQEISGDNLARELNKVADSVGWSFLQVHILPRIKKTQVIAISKNDFNGCVLCLYFIHLFYLFILFLCFFYLLVIQYMYLLFIYLIINNDLSIIMYLQSEYSNLRYQEAKIDGQNHVREVRTYIPIRHPNIAI